MAASDSRSGCRLPGQSDAQTIKLETCTSGQVRCRDVGHFDQRRNDGAGVVPATGVHQAGDCRANGSGDGHRRQPEPSRLGAGPACRCGQRCWRRRTVSQPGSDQRRQGRFARTTHRSATSERRERRKGESGRSERIGRLTGHAAIIARAVAGQKVGDCCGRCGRLYLVVCPPRQKLCSGWTMRPSSSSRIVCSWVKRASRL